jgi:hypothetical protein
VGSDARVGRGEWCVDGRMALDGGWRESGETCAPQSVRADKVMEVNHLFSSCSALSVPDFVVFSEEHAGEALEICDQFDCRIEFQSTGVRFVITSFLFHCFTIIRAEVENSHHKMHKIQFVYQLGSA